MLPCISPTGCSCSSILILNLSVFIATPLLFLLGIALQKFLINPVLKVESILPEDQVILTVGIGMVLANLATIFFKSDYRFHAGQLCNQCLVPQRLLEDSTHRAFPISSVDRFLYFLRLLLLSCSGSF